MKLKAVYQRQEDIPEGYEDLYTERNGQWELTGIEGVKTEADVDRLKSALEKEREAHKETKQKFSFLNDHDLEDVQKRLDNYDELEARAGDVDEEKIEKLVEARVRSKVAPIERENNQLKEQNQELTGTVEGFQQKERSRTISDHIREAGQKLKVRDSAVEDAIVLGQNSFELDEEGNVVTKDGIGVTPGVNPEVWLQEMQEKRPHWWPDNEGPNAGGNRGGGKGFSQNPWTADHWNLTKQGQVYNENPEKAAQMAKAAGTEVGGSKPSK